MATAKNVDFSNVKDGGGFNKHRVPEGDYLATITKVEDSPAKGDGVFQYLFTIKLKKHSQYAYPYYCKLQENQLWKLRNIAIAAGLNVPKRRVKFDPSKVLGKTIGVTMEDDEYEGKMQSNIAAVFPAAELMDGSQVEDDEPIEDEDVAEDDEDVEDEVEDEGDEFADMDRAALKAYIKERQSDFVAKKSQTDDDLRELARGLGDAEEEPEDDEDEEEEPEPAPAPRRRAAAAKPAAKKTSRRSTAEVSDEELEDLDIDDI